MMNRFSVIQKVAFGYALLFLAVYSMDFIPGVMDANGKMFGLFSMTTFVDVGHLGLGTLALISGFVGPRTARGYFWFLGVFYALDVIIYVARHLHLISPVTNMLVNAPHFIISVSAFLVALYVGKGLPEQTYARA